MYIGRIMKSLESDSLLLRAIRRGPGSGMTLVAEDVVKVRWCCCIVSYGQRSNASTL
jgi:hypothetical protein